MSSVTVMRVRLAVGARAARLLALLSSLLALATLLSACATKPEFDLVPSALAETAEIPEMSRIRIWGDGSPGAAAAFVRSEQKALRARNVTRGPTTSHLLALSGGGSNGAFGAGLLIGWGERGDRPVFDLVTGISAGSLLAPFAFLGREYDRELAAVFVKYGEEDFYQAKILNGVLGGPAVADNGPLAALIDKLISDRMIARIGQERAKGRFLLIGTTNLNAERPVFWDMGRIAQVGTKKGNALFRKILLASAAVPGIFPPVEIPVRAGGRTFVELHVDGGLTRQVFLSPSDFSFTQIDAVRGTHVDRRLWIVRNGKIDPEYKTDVSLSAVSISGRSLGILTKSQGVGDLIRMYEKSVSDGIDYNLASIPADFTDEEATPFSRTYMKTLFDKGYRLGRGGYQWAKAPPGIGVTAGR